MTRVKGHPGQRSARREINSPATAPPHPGRWLTRIAFGLSLALVLARATILEAVHTVPFLDTGNEAAPRAPGPATMLVLDLACCVPALLVLARRALDACYPLRKSWSFVPLAPLGLWVMLSTLWAGNKLEAAVSGFTFFSALVLLWSTAQLIRSPLRLRLTAAVCFGLLLTLLAQGLYYRYVEAPDLRREWETHGAEVLQARGWEPDSFEARRFSAKVMSNELMGFNASPNTYAAVLVLLTLVTTGIALQRARERQPPLNTVVLLAPIPVALFVLALTRSKAAIATLVLGEMLIGLAWFLHVRIARRRRLVYFGIVTLVAIGAALLVAVGLSRGSLYNASLTFRWRYWVAAGRLFAMHPLLGVGWENFGPNYLAVRLPEAAEEVRDPHNFIVRSFVELGIVGGLLMLAWILRLGWDLMRPSGDPIEREPAFANDDDSPGSRGLSLAMVCLLAICINTVASLDFDQPGAYVAMELIKRLGMFFLLAGGAILAGLRSFNDTRADNRSAPVLLWALGIALGMFLLHNLIDFSLFETGPLFLFALLAGAALGGRVPVATSTTRAAEQGHTHGPGRAGRKIAVGCLAGAILGWLLVARAFVLPVLLAESSAAAAEENLRRGQFPEAVAAFEQAAQTVPYQGEYWYRAARAAIPPRAPHERVRGLIHRAIAADPGNVEYRLLSANYELAQPIVNVPRVRDDFERALRLDPNNVALRLRYAEALRRVGEVAEARHQFEEALRYNDLLPPDEPKRLSPTRVQEIRAQAER